MSKPAILQVPKLIATKHCLKNWVRATFISVHFSAIYGRALLGLGDHSGAIRYFEAFFQAEENESLPIARNYCFPACLGAGEAWLAQGQSSKARYHAQRLHDLSIEAPEHTYLALSHRLFAEIAMEEKALEEAGSQIIEALGIVENAEVPVAAWRVYASAEKLHRLQGEASSANQYEIKKLNAVDKLLGSLQAADPLCEHLSNFVRVNAARRLIDLQAQTNPVLPSTDMFCDAA